jgi:integrase
MASIQKTAAGWRVQIARKGVRKSQTFATKSAAVQWAAREETAILDGAAEAWPRKTLGDALRRYENEVSPAKSAGAQKFDKHTVTTMLERHPALCAKLLHQITPDDLATWRDETAKRVSGSTVQRYINTLRNVWTVAGLQWQWCPHPSPWRAIKMPDQAPARDRLIGWREARLILRRLGYVTGQAPQSKGQQVAHAFLLSLRTGLRAGELLNLSGATVDLDGRVITLHQHKTLKSAGKRRVPLTSRAHRLLSVLSKDGSFFDVSAASVDALFRKARDQVLVSDLHFHDARATALTHLARRVDVMTLARISGHLDVSMLLRCYYRESAESISARLG